MPVTETAKVTSLPGATTIDVFVGCSVTPGGLPTVNVNNCVAVDEKASAAFTVKLKTPLVVGVPEITPFVANASPLGKTPETSVQLKGGWPSMADN